MFFYLPALVRAFAYTASHAFLVPPGPFFITKNELCAPSRPMNTYTLFGTPPMYTGSFLGFGSPLFNITTRTYVTYVQYTVQHTELRSLSY